MAEFSFMVLLVISVIRMLRKSIFIKSVNTKIHVSHFVMTYNVEDVLKKILI